MGGKGAVEGEHRAQGGYAQDECLEERALGLKGSMNFHFSVLMVWAFAGGEHGRLGLNDEDDRLTAFCFLL